MKKLPLAIFAVLQMLFLHHIFACGQTMEPVRFTDDSELKIPTNHVADQTLSARRIASFKVLKKEAIFDYESANKVGFSILPGNLTKKLLARNRRLFNKIDRVTTSYSLAQNGKSFSIDGFVSVRDASLYDCRKCSVKASLVLLEIELNDAVYHIPFIESFVLLKENSPELR